MADLDDMFGDDVCDDIVQKEEEKQLRPASSGVLAFHNGTEEALYHYVKNKVQPGDVTGILKAIDEFCYTQHWMMHIGDQKLPLLDKSLKLARENTSNNTICAVELGSYCGYSALYIGSQLNKESGDHLYAIEKDPKCVKWTQRMVTLAGLEDRVTVIESAAAELESWRTLLNKSHIDLLFIDHDKSQYLTDLLLIENAHLLSTGSIVVADNVLSFGVPLTDYLTHVRDPKGLYRSSELYPGFIEYAKDRDVSIDASTSPELVDGVEISEYR